MKVPKTKFSPPIALSRLLCVWGGGGGGVPPTHKLQIARHPTKCIFAHTYILTCKKFVIYVASLGTKHGPCFSLLCIHEHACFSLLECTRSSPSSDLFQKIFPFFGFSNKTCMFPLQGIDMRFSFSKLNSCLLVRLSRKPYLYLYYHENWSGL
jgi:hypothetical protein